MRSGAAAVAASVALAVPVLAGAGDANPVHAVTAALHALGYTTLVARYCNPQGPDTWLCSVQNRQLHRIGWVWARRTQTGAIVIVGRRVGTLPAGG